MHKIDIIHKKEKSGRLKEFSFKIDGQKIDIVDYKIIQSATKDAPAKVNITMYADAGSIIQISGEDI